MSTTFGAIPLPPARTPAVREWLYVPTSRWLFAMFGAIVLAVLAMPHYADDSMWIGVGLVLTVLALAHGVMASRAMPWIPSLVLGIACLQWILAPWIAYHLPPTYTLYSMIVPAEQYFAYAVPSTLALAAGVYLPLALRPPGRSERPPVGGMSLRLQVTCDGMIVGGILSRVVLQPIAPPGGRFLAVLLWNLSFVGLFALLIARVPGWQWRLVPVFAVLVAYSSLEGMFHDFVLWTAYLAFIAAFARRVSGWRLSVAGLAILVVAFVINGIKQDFRWMIQAQGGTITERTALLGNAFFSGLGRQDAFGLETIRLNVTRVNQGWIIARVLEHVPGTEPFARGETVGAAVRAAILPRVFDPAKLQIGGQTYFERFTGVPLGRASMDLSVAGEMYANFGVLGGILGVLVFGLLLGLAYRLFARWAQDSALWWAWAPFVLLYGAKAEGGLAEPLNHIAKSFVVMIAFIAVVPAWAMLRKVTLRRAAERLLHRRGRLARSAR